MTQSVITGIHFANKQSIIALTISSLFWILKLIKLVSTMTKYGGFKASLCLKKREDDGWSMCRTAGVSAGAFLAGFKRASFFEIIRLTRANFFVFLTLGIFKKKSRFLWQGDCWHQDNWTSAS